MKILVFFMVLLLGLTGCSLNKNGCGQYSNDVFSMERCINKKIRNDLNSKGYTPIRPVRIGNLSKDDINKLNNTPADPVSCSLESGDASKIEVCENSHIENELHKSGFILLDRIVVQGLRAGIKKNTEPMIIADKVGSQSNSRSINTIPQQSLPIKTTNSKSGNPQPINKLNIKTKKSILTMCKSLDNYYKRALANNKKMNIINLAKRNLDRCIIKKQKLLSYTR